MTLQNSQASLFDNGDAEAVTERGANNSQCGFCAVLRGDQKAALYPA